MFSYILQFLFQMEMPNQNNKDIDKFENVNLPFETGNSNIKSEVKTEPVVKQEIVEPENYKAFETESFLIKSKKKQEVGKIASNNLPFETENLTLKSEIKMEPAVKEEIFDPENYKVFETGNLLIKSEVKFEPSIKP